MSGVRAVFVTTRKIATFEDLMVVPPVDEEIEIDGVRYRIAAHVWSVSDCDALDRYNNTNRRLSVAIYLVVDKF